ncbi:MAG: hypothetical protein II886_07860 [Prevotella sp.]|nr:hypothetical protein [Prevotella sp.]
MGRFNVNLGSLADEIVTECDFVTFDQTRRVKALRAMWDTGSNATILSAKLISELRPERFGQGGMTGIGGQYEGDTYLVHVSLPTGDVITYQEVYEANLGDYDAIIGMDIITRGNFHLDCDHGEILFSFELPNE